MKELDIHNSRKKIEYARSSIFRSFSEENARTASEFFDRLVIENKSYGRIANYAESVKRILLIKDDKSISEWTRKEIESIHMAISESDYENSVKKDTSAAWKRSSHSVHTHL